MIEKLTQAKRLVEAFIALMVGRQARVHWDGVGSMDNQGGIHLPPPKTGDAAEIALLTRLAVHEGGHTIETEQGFVDRLSKEELTIFNCLEDPRMENRQLQRYPGAGIVLSRGLDEMLDRIEANLDDTLAAMPERAVHLDIFLRGFLSVAPHGPIGRRAPGILQRLTPHIEDAQRTAIDEAVAKLPSMTTSLEAEQAARHFLARLRELEPPAQQDQQADQGEPREPSNEQQGPPPPGQDQRDQQDQQDQQGQRDEQEPSPDASGGGQEQQPESAATDANDPSPQGGGAGGGAGGPDEEDGPNEDAGNGEQSSGGNPESGGDVASDASGGAGQPEDPASAEQGGQPGASAAGDGSATNAAGTEQQPKESGGTDPSGPASGSSPSVQQQVGPPEQEGSQPQQGGQPFDLGQLLRDAHVARYGPAEPAQRAAAAGQAGEELSDEELQRVAALLAQADSSESLEELVNASLAALAAGEASDAGEDAVEVASAGAGMHLASAPAAPATLIETRLQGVQSRLVTVLQRELQDKRRRPTRAAYGGRVMPQRFWRLGAVGDTKVFVHRQPASGIDAAATVLLDSSESMELQLTVAAEVTMAFSLALQRLGVRTRVARFPGVETVTETIQRFGESARSCVHRCADLTASGGTPIGAAVALETPALLQQRKLKNVLAIVTDDAPGDKAALAAALERADELDILVVGVGIGCDIRIWIPHSVSVQTVNELPDALARLFRENITQKLAA